MKNFYKKYKVYIYIAIVLLIGISSFILMKNFLYPDDFKSVYGSRLDGIEGITISNERKDEIKKVYLVDSVINSVELDIKGKIINVIIDGKESYTIEVAKETISESLKDFKDEEKAFYDIQFFVKNEILKYTMIGYKNKTSEIVVWSEYSEVIDEIEEEQ